MGDNLWVVNGNLSDFFFERNGENKSKIDVKKVTKDFQNKICNFGFRSKLDIKIFL